MKTFWVAAAAAALFQASTAFAGPMRPSVSTDKSGNAYGLSSGRNPFSSSAIYGPQGHPINRQIFNQGSGGWAHFFSGSGFSSPQRSRKPQKERGDRSELSRRDWREEWHGRQYAESRDPSPQLFEKF